MKFLKKTIAFNFLFIVLVFPICSAEVLLGNAVLITENGEEVPATNIRKIAIHNTDIKIWQDDIDKNGDFKIDLTNKGLYSGNKIRFQVECDGWSIYAPVDAEIYIPSDLKREVVSIKLIANSSEVSVGNYSAQFSAKNIFVIQGSRNHFVQVFATESIDKAIQIQSLLVEKGFYNASYSIAYYTGERKGLDSYYKVVVGPYDSKDAATKARNIIRNYDIFKKSYVVPWVN